MKKEKKNGGRWLRRKVAQKAKESVGEFEIVIPGVSRKGEVRNERTDGRVPLYVHLWADGVGLANASNERTRCG